MAEEKLQCLQAKKRSIRDRKGKFHFLQSGIDHHILTESSSGLVFHSLLLKEKFQTWKLVLEGSWSSGRLTHSSLNSTATTSLQALPRTALKLFISYFWPPLVWQSPIGLLSSAASDWYLSSPCLHLVSVVARPPSLALLNSCRPHKNN